MAKVTVKFDRDGFSLNAPKGTLNDYELDISLKPEGIAALFTAIGKAVMEVEEIQTQLLERKVAAEAAKCKINNINNR